MQRPTSVTVFGVLNIVLVYPIILLVFMLRPNVAAAFRRPPMDLPQ